MPTIVELTIEDVVRKIGEIGIIPVVRASSVEEANRAVEAICAGGIPVVEITMTVPNAIQAESCVRAGAQFLVSPGLALSVLSVARVHNRLAIPGALTPTELMNAQEHGG